MERIKKPILITTVVWLLAQMSPILGSGGIVMLATVITFVMVIWMVIRVLKDGTPSDQTFDDQFYETDSPIDKRA